MNSHNSKAGTRAVNMALLGWLCLTLFLITLNATAVCLQIAGHYPLNVSGGLLCYLAGIACCLFCLPWWMRHMAGPGKKRHLARATFFLAMIMPTVIFMVAGTAWPEPTEARLAYYARAVFSGMLPPVALRAFFRTVPARGRPFYLGLSMGIAYGYWALLMPILGQASPTPDAMGRRWILLLYALYCAVSVSFAGTALCLLSGPEAVERRRGSPAGPGSGGAVRANRARLALMLTPLAVASLSSGYLGLRFSFRFLPFNAYHEYIPLALALLFPLAGLLTLEKSDRILSNLLVAGSLIFAAAPPLAMLIPKFSLAYAVLATLGVMGMQVVFFVSILVCARFSGRKGDVFILSLPWIVPCICIPVALLTRSALMDFSIAVDGLIWALGVVSLGSALLLWLNARRQPTAELHAGMPVSAEPADANAKAGAEEQQAGRADAAPPSEAMAKIRDFAGRHNLSRREREILELLAQGRSTEEMSALLHLKESTVRRYVNSLLQKTGSASRLGLVAALAFPEKPSPGDSESGSR